MYLSDPQRIAFVGDASLTFGEIRSKAEAIAGALSAAGLRPGDRVVIATSHGSKFYTCFAACYLSGFTVAVIDPAAGLQELASMVGKAAPAAVIADEGILQRLAEYSENSLPDLAWRIEGLGDKGGVLARWSPKRWTRTARDWPSLDDIVSTKTAPIVAPIPDETPAYIMFTSGTTSKPKAVIVSRHALSHHVATLARVFGYGTTARLLSYLPTHHTDGLVHGVAASLLTGMTVVHPGTFSASANLHQVLRTNEISHFLTVPTILAIIRRTFADRPDLFQTGQFRTLISTAGYLDASFWGEFQEFFGIRVSNFYGMTETVSGSLYCGPDSATFRLDTLGKAVDAEIRIVDERGAVVPRGEIGELQIAGDHLMAGYLDDLEATQATIANGWLSTGDLFSQDADGFFHIAGRLKNIIKRGGITVYPEDIRKLIVELPGVVEVEVIGLADPVFEEIIAVCAVVDAGVDAEAIRALCRRHLSPERRPDRIELMEKLPRGPSGKVQRDALTEILAERGATPQRSPSALRDRVLHLAAETFAAKPAELDEASSPDTVANWDSYAGMEFVTALEKEFGLRLSPRDIMRLRNVGQAIAIVSAGIDVGENEP